jgi:hypothetical protein
LAIVFCTRFLAPGEAGITQEMRIWMGKVIKYSCWRRKMADNVRLYR